MRLVKPEDLDIAQVHLDRNDAPWFDIAQPWRIALARGLVWRILDDLPSPATIWELGCGAGDICGAFSNPHQVHGVDLVPVAQTFCAQRWPNMDFQLAKIEDVEPQDSDILILTEVLEHLTDPLQVARDWIPRAKWIVVGHPIISEGPDHEHGHRWAYDRQDFANWFSGFGHDKLEEYHFGNPYPDMVMGVGRRR